jgi:hypothetical protein
LELTFNRALEPDGTSATVWRLNDGESVDTAVSVDSTNPRRLTVRLLNPAVGDYQLHWHAVATQLAGESSQSSDGEEAFTVKPGSPAPPRVDVSPAIAEVGDRLELVGKGFGPRSTIHLTVGDDDQPLTTADADGNGTFNVEAKVPDSLPFGIQPVSVVDSQGRKATTSLQIHWGGWPPAVVADNGQAGPVPGEITFSVNVRNRSDYVLEHVQVVMKDPDGATLVGTDPNAERQDDTVVWQLPVMERGAAGPFRATYRASSAVISHSWLLYRHRRPRGCRGTECLPAFISESTGDSQPVGPAEGLPPATDAKVRATS